MPEQRTEHRLAVRKYTNIKYKEHYKVPNDSMDCKIMLMVTFVKYVCMYVCAYCAFI